MKKETIKIEIVLPDTIGDRSIANFIRQLNVSLGKKCILESITPSDKGQDTVLFKCSVALENFEAFQDIYNSFYPEAIEKQDSK